MSLRAHHRVPAHTGGEQQQPPQPRRDIPKPLHCLPSLVLHVWLREGIPFVSESAVHAIEFALRW